MVVDVDLGRGEEENGFFFFSAFGLLRHSAFCDAMRCNETRRDETRRDSMGWDAMQCNTMQRNARTGTNLTQDEDDGDERASRRYEREEEEDCGAASTDQPIPVCEEGGDRGEDARGGTNGPVFTTGGTNDATTTTAVDADTGKWNGTGPLGGVGMCRVFFSPHNFLRLLRESETRDETTRALAIALFPSGSHLTRIGRPCR